MRSAVAHLRHPKGTTCLPCGFLGSGDKELIAADRILLSSKDSAEHPPLTKVRCTRSLWIDYDLRNFENARDGIFTELHKRRRPCEGFLRYRPGWSPSEHRDLLQTKIQTKTERREKILITAVSSIGGSVLTLLGAWLLKRWGLK